MQNEVWTLQYESVKENNVHLTFCIYVYIGLMQFVLMFSCLYVVE